jgi:hypothetical protein
MFRRKKEIECELKYDIQIIVPCIKSRLDFFQKYGLFNIGDTKIRVYCLVDNIEDFTEGWPDNPNLTVELVEFPECENQKIVEKASYKLFKFLHEISYQKINQAKWTLKLDDDCVNDISEINYFLESEYDYTRDYYIVGETRIEMHFVEQDILKKLNLWDKINQRFEHELECCYLSRSAFEKIMKDPLCREIFKEKYVRSIKNKGYTDQLFGIVAKLHKIYPTEQNGSLITSGRNNNVLECFFLSREQKYKLGNKQMKYASHYHPVKEYLHQFVIEADLKSKGISEEEIRAQFPTPTPTCSQTVTPTITLTNTITASSSTPTPTPTPTLTATPTLTFVPKKIF